MQEEHAFKPSNTPIAPSKYEAPYELDRTRVLDDLFPLGRGRSALDIGCGLGHFSAMLTAKGWRTTGIDTDPQNIERAAGVLVESFLGDAVGVTRGLPESQFDLVLALEIIEHMPKSIGADLLGAIWRVLSPEGTLILSTPNRTSLEGLGGYYWGEKIRRCGKWYAWDATHVYIYTAREMLGLLRETGFAIEGVTGFYYGGYLPVIRRYELPILKSSFFPLNRVGFNTIIRCRKRVHSGR